MVGQRVAHCQTLVAALLAAGLTCALAVGSLGCGVSPSDDGGSDGVVQSRSIDVRQAANEAGVPVKDVAAVVNGEVVTWSDVKDRITLLRSTRGLTEDSAYQDYLRGSGMSESDLAMSVLKTLVDETLITVDARNHDIDVDESQIDDRIQRLIDRFPSHAAFVAALERKGYTEESYRKAVLVSILSSKLRTAVIPDTGPTEEQIKEYAYVVAPSLAGRRSSQILFSQTQYAQAVQVYARLLTGEDFATLAREYSIDGSGENGGDMGWDSMNTFVSAYQDALDDLEPGEISPIIHTDFGYMIIKCTERYEPTYDEDGSIDLTTMPSDLIEYIKEQMMSSLTDEAFNGYVKHLEADAALAVFDQSGAQIDPASIGLATYATTAGASSATPSASEIAERSLAASSVDDDLAVVSPANGVKDATEQDGASVLAKAGGAVETSD